MTDHEKDFLSKLQKAFPKNGYHFDFDLPSDPDELQQLQSTIKNLAAEDFITIIAAPDTTGDDFIEIELSPSCV